MLDKARGVTYNYRRRVTGDTPRTLGGMSMNDNNYYIVRGKNSGVFFGNIKAQNGQEVTMTNVRRLWYWAGAASISQLAAEGTKSPSSCKFTQTVDEMIVLDAIELDLCSDKAVVSICGVPVWSIR